MKKMIESLAEDFLVPDRIMFEYDEEKKKELIGSKNKDTEKKIRNEILEKIVTIFKGEVNEVVDLINKNKAGEKVEEAKEVEGEKEQEEENTEPKNKEKPNKLEKLIKLISFLKNYFYCNENIKRGGSVTLLAELFDRLDFSDIPFEYLEEIILFFIKKIEDWHCVYGVLKFFLVFFEKYQNILEKARYFNEITPLYRDLFISKKKRKKEAKEIDVIKNDRSNSDDEILQGVLANECLYETSEDEENYEDEEDIFDRSAYLEELNDSNDNDDDDECTEDEKIKEINLCVIYKILKHLFKHVHAPSYPQKLENEPDPRNILVLFDIIYILCNAYISPIESDNNILMTKEKFPCRIIQKDITEDDLSGHISCTNSVFQKVEEKKDHLTEDNEFIDARENYVSDIDEKRKEKLWKENNEGGNEKESCLCVDSGYAESKEFFSIKDISEVYQNYKEEKDKEKEKEKEKENRKNSNENKCENENENHNGNGWDGESLFSYEVETTYLKSTIDIAFYYFPIEFINRGDKCDSITEEDLWNSFFKCLKSNKRLGNYVIMNILDQVYNSEDEELSEKKLSDILRTLEICVPYYGCLCSSQFVTTVLGLIDLECIEANCSKRMMNYFIDILLVFLNVINEEKGSMKYEIFNEYFLSIFKKFQKYVILHKCMYKETNWSMFDSFNIFDHEKGLYNRTVAFSEIPSEKKRDDENENENENENGEDTNGFCKPMYNEKYSNTKDGNINDFTFIEDKYFANVLDLTLTKLSEDPFSSSSNNSSDVDEENIKEIYPSNNLYDNFKDYDNFNEDSCDSEINGQNKNNIFMVIKEKDEIQKLEEAKEQKRKRNKIKIDKFDVIENILISISKTNTYIFLYTVNYIVKPLLRECFYLINILTRDGNPKTVVEKEATILVSEHSKIYNEEINNKLEGEENRKELKRETKTEKRKKYEKLEEGNIVGKEAEKQLKNKKEKENGDIISEEKEIKRTKLKQNKYLNILLLYIKFLNNVIEKSINAEEFTLHNICFIKEIYLLIEILKKGKTLFLTEKCRKSGLRLFSLLTHFICIHTMKRNFVYNIYFFKSIFCFFYIIGLHPNENNFIFCYQEQKKLYEIRFIDFEFLDIWKNEMLKNNSSFVNDIKKNNENILNKKYSYYKSNDLLFFLNLISKIIKYKYESIQYYLNSILVNLSLLIWKLYFCHSKNITLLKNILTTQYGVDVTCLIFLSTNLCFFILKHFFNFTEKVKSDLLSWKNGKSHEHCITQKWEKGNDINNPSSNACFVALTDRENEEKMHMCEKDEERSTYRNTGETVQIEFLNQKTEIGNFSSEDQPTKLHKTDTKTKNILNKENIIYVENEGKHIDELYNAVYKEEEKEENISTTLFQDETIKLTSTFNIKNLFYKKEQLCDEQHQREQCERKVKESKIIVNENVKKEELFLFYSSFIFNVFYKSVYYEKARIIEDLENRIEANKNISAFSSSSSYYYNGTANEKEKKNLNSNYSSYSYLNKNDFSTLYQPRFISVNNCEIFEILINYLFEERVIKHLIKTKMEIMENKKCNSFVHSDNIQVLNEDTIYEINEMENKRNDIDSDSPYYTMYKNNADKTIDINNISKITVKEFYGERREMNQDEFRDLYKYAKMKNCFLNTIQLSIDKFFNILQTVLSINQICQRMKLNERKRMDEKGERKEEDTQKEKKQENEVKEEEFSQFAQYLLLKMKKNLLRVFVYLNDINKKYFLENCIDYCLSEKNERQVGNETDIFFQICERDLRIGSVLGKYNCIHILLLFFVPPLLVFYDSVSKNYVHKIIKLSMYILLYNIYKTNICFFISEEYVDTRENEENGRNQNKKEIQKGERILCEYEQLLIFLTNKMKTILKSKKVNENDSDLDCDHYCFNDNNIKMDLEKITIGEWKKLYTTALEIMSMVIYNCRDGREGRNIRNFLYAHLELKECYYLQVKDALLFKNVIDQFTCIYKAYVTKYREKKFKQEEIQKTKKTGSRQVFFFLFLSTLFGVSFGSSDLENCNRLLFLCDMIYFENKNNERKGEGEGKGEGEDEDENEDEGRREGDLRKCTNESTNESTEEGGNINVVWVVNFRKLNDRENDKNRKNGVSSNILYELCNIKKIEKKISRHIHLFNMNKLFTYEDYNDKREVEEMQNESMENVSFCAHMFFSLHQCFSILYDLQHCVKNGDTIYVEENLENTIGSLRSSVLDCFICTLFYYTYVSTIYSNIFSFVYNIDTTDLFEKRKYKSIHFLKNENFIYSYKNIIINFLYIIFNYLYFVDITKETTSITQFLFLLNEKNIAFEYALPCSLARGDKKTIYFIENFVIKEMESRKKKNEYYAQGELNGITETVHPYYAIKQHNSNHENTNYRANDDTKNQMKYNSTGNDIAKDNVFDAQVEGFLRKIKKRKKQKINKFKCKYTGLIHMMSIFLLNIPFEEVLENYYPVLELCLLKGMKNVADFFINKKSYSCYSKKYINEVLRTNMNIIKEFFSNEDNEKIDSMKKNEYKKIIIKQIISFNLLLCLRLVYLFYRLLNYYIKHKDDVNLNLENNERVNILKKNLHFLMSYKNKLIKSVINILISVPFGLIRYISVCILYMLSFFQSDGFMDYSIIQDIHWHLSVASEDPHKKVRQLVVLCRAKWM